MNLIDKDAVLANWARSNYKPRAWEDGVNWSPLVIDEWKRIYAERSLDNGTEEFWYEEGKTRGYNIATWQELPTVGVEYFTDSQGRITVEDEVSASEVFMEWCYNAESNSRQFSPFEYTAKAINDKPNAEELWEAFGAGITDGFTKCWNNRTESWYDFNRG